MNFKSLPTQPRSQGPLLPGPTKRDNEMEPRNEVSANIDIFNHIQFLISGVSEGAVEGVSTNQFYSPPF